MPIRAARRRAGAAVPALVLVLSGCVPIPPPQPAMLAPPAAPTPPVAALPAADRIARFSHLAEQLGAAPPEVQQVQLPPGSGGAAGSIAVTRLTVDAGVFFDTAEATPRPEASRVLDSIAAAMRQDVPDAAMTVLGHTDDIGTDEYNLDLSRRRAAAVLAALVQRGVNPDQLSTIAVGKRQPIAPNDTPEGRARNRRVEFLISTSEAANLAAIGLAAPVEAPVAALAAPAAPFIQPSDRRSPVVSHPSSVKRLQSAPAAPVEVRPPQDVRLKSLTDDGVSY